MHTADGAISPWSTVGMNTRRGSLVITIKVLRLWRIVVTWVNLMKPEDKVVHYHANAEADQHDKR